MTAGPGYEPASGGRGRLRASHADREQMIDVLKAAFVQGRLTIDEFDARVGQAFTARTYAELATVTADIPVGLSAARPPGETPGRPMGNTLRWGASGLITPAVLAVAFVVTFLHGAGGLEAATFLIASGYFMFWLSAGASMLWGRRR